MMIIPRLGTVHRLEEKKKDSDYIVVNMIICHVSIGLCKTENSHWIIIN